MQYNVQQILFQIEYSVPIDSNKQQKTARKGRVLIN